MIKPWLLMNAEERQARLDDYAWLRCEGIRHPPANEMLLAALKPPGDQAAALLELFLYQQRAKAQR